VGVDAEVKAISEPFIYQGERLAYFYEVPAFAAVKDAAWVADEVKNHLA
jgi:hypothetical protein